MNTPHNITHTHLGATWGLPTTVRMSSTRQVLRRSTQFCEWMLNHEARQRRALRWVLSLLVPSFTTTRCCSKVEKRDHKGIQGKVLGKTVKKKRGGGREYVPRWRYR